MKFLVLFCTKDNFKIILGHLMAPQVSGPLKLVSYEFHNAKDTFFSKTTAKHNVDFCQMSHRLFDTMEEAKAEINREIVGQDFPSSEIFKIRDWDSALILQTDNINPNEALTDHTVKKIFEKPFHEVFFMKPSKDPQKAVFQTIAFSEAANTTPKAKL